MFSYFREMTNLIGYHHVAIISWIFIWMAVCSGPVQSDEAGTKCRDVYISPPHFEAPIVPPVSSAPSSKSEFKNIYSSPFQGKICVSHYPETWDTAYRVCHYDFSYLLSLNIFNLNYSDIKPIIGDAEILHIGMRREYGIFNWIGLKPEMFHTSINQSDWGWQWHDDEPQENHCVAINVRTGKLLTVSCTDKLLNFICASVNGLNTTSKLCNPGWKYSHFSKLCLLEASVPFSNTNAVDFCRSQSSRLMSTKTYLASFSALRFKSTISQKLSRVWLKTDIRNSTCYYGECNTNRTTVDKQNCLSLLGLICEQDPLTIDIKVKLKQTKSQNTSLEDNILICELYINGSKEFTSSTHYVWRKNGEILSANIYLLVFGYYSGIEKWNTVQGQYWCEVVTPGYPDRISSVPNEFYHTGVSTILMVIESNGIPYDPIRYDRSKPDFEEKFLPIIEKKFPVIFTNFTKEFPHLPLPEWQLINASKRDNFTTLKINIFLNHEGKVRPANEKEDIFKPVWGFLFQQCRNGISEWELRKCDISNIGMCLAESTRTSIGDVVWNQTYHSKHVASVPMCLSVDWKILTRSCVGGYGNKSQWSPFDQNQCVRFNKVLENNNHHHCQPGYTSWNYTTCIRIYSNPANWSEAAAECGRSLGFLFTPRLTSRNTFLLRNFNSNFKIFEKLGEIWLGGHRENGVMQWMAFEPGPVELSKSTEVEWEEKYDLGADCVSGIIGNGKILAQNKPCKERKPYICMHKNPEGQLYSTSECRGNSYGSPWLNFCFLANKEAFTWNDALTRCRDYKPDGTLAVLISPEENDLLKNHLLKQFRPSQNDTWWIGLERINNYFLWLNSNRSKTTYVDWYLDAEHNLTGSAVAFRKKDYEEDIRWVQLNQTTKLPSICQTSIIAGTTWCKVSVRRDAVLKTDIYKCELGRAVYGSVTWYKDGIAISGNRGLIETGPEEFSPIDLLNNSVLPLKEYYQLQGYYWCEMQQKDPFVSVASPNVLFVDNRYWTFVGRFIMTKVEGHYDIGQKKFWNVTGEISKSLKRIIFTERNIKGILLAKDIYITDLSRVDKGNEMKFYIYSQPAGGKRNEFSKKKKHIEEIKQHILQQLKKAGSALVEKYGIISEKVSVMSTEDCFFEETIVGGKSLIWRTTPAGESALPTQNCIAENGHPVIRRCLGNFTHGVHWGPIDGSCSEKASNFTLSLKILSEKRLEYSNMKNTSETLEMLTRNSDELIGMDIHYIATTLENIANQKRYSTMVVDNVAATVNNVMAVQQQIIENVQRRVNASLRIVASLETVLKDSKKMHAITKPNIAVINSPLKVKDGPKIVGLVSKDRDADGFQVGDVSSVDSDSQISYTKLLAGIWLPLDLVEERIGPNSYINFILYRNATLFITPTDIQKTTTIISPVISAFFSDGPVHLYSPRIKLTFKTLHTEKELPESARCVYWEQSMNGKQGGWSSTGCAKPIQKLDYITCYCDHLTSFAVLVDLYGDDNDNMEDSAHGVVLDIITYIGCTLSIFGLLLTIITFAMFRKLRNGVGSQVLCNLSVSLLLTLIVFMAGINQTHWKPGCMVVAALLHYLLMVAFSWMLVEAVLQYLRLVKVIGTYIPRFILKSALCAWGIPLLVVISILAIDYELYHSKKNYCWIHIKAFYYGFLVPVALVMICNIIIFSLIVHSISCGRQKGLRTNQNERKLAITRLRAACCILFLLGLSWSFGFLAISDARLVFKYLFSIFTTLQGFFIFLFHVVQEKTTRNLWYNYLFLKKDSQVQTFTTRDTSTFVSRNK